VINACFIQNGVLNYTIQNMYKNATLIKMHGTIDHTSQDVEVYKHSLAPKMGCMAYK
jgi:hypothetical protein